ncbi:transporter [Porphyromonas macacae]|uniref:putative transporter n=1 Tax=Porphyromonas macacae TaxID=28115 RepID=UPI00052D780C|nr:putative transporter [Porphyromonas macacae]KGN99911.1 transporter [Porphyromonas macacae]
MDWFTNLFMGTGTAHSIFLLAMTISIGILMGRIRIFGISLGVTFVLFAGILFSHLGMTMNPELLHLFQEFGLILFVYSVGLQVGPGFFSSLKKGGLKLNLTALGVVFLGVFTTIALHYVTGVDMATMVGVLSGAVTNTPGLGAAQQAYSDVMGSMNPSIAMGYAVAYPLGVIGIIMTTIVLRYILRINLKEEQRKLENEDEDSAQSAIALSLVVKNPSLFGQSIAQMNKNLSNYSFVISRHWNIQTNKITVASSQTVLHDGDRIFVITTEQDHEFLKSFVGEEMDLDRKMWIPTDSKLISNRFVITNKELNGKKLGNLKLRQLEGVNITRVNRAGIDLVATPNMPLQLGDKLTVVGSEAAMPKIKEILGDSVKHLHEPNLISIFFGIALGILLGSIPFDVPGVPQSVKLGLAGGPLIVAIIMGRFGHTCHIVTYTTQSANKMLREIGITLFLACVGLNAGGTFVETLNNGGWIWVGYGVVITVLPLLIMGIVAVKILKINYYTLMGLLAGSTTDPPALAYANVTSQNGAPMIGYATVYPLTMFMRVITAQLLILLYCVA